MNKMIDDTKIWKFGEKTLMSTTCLSKLNLRRLCIVLNRILDSNPNNEELSNLVIETLSSIKNEEDIIKAINILKPIIVEFYSETSKAAESA